jgi:hypothetical protein
MPELRSPIAVPAAHRTIGAERVDATHHQPRIARAEDVIAESHAVDGARLEVLDHHVGTVDQPVDRGQTLRVAKVDAYAALVAVAG